MEPKDLSRIEAEMFAHLRKFFIQGPDAEDIVQETFFRVISKQDRFRPEPNQDELVALRRWVFGFLRRVRKEYIREKISRADFFSELSAEPSSNNEEMPVSELDLPHLHSYRLVREMKSGWLRFLLLTSDAPSTRAADRRLVKFLLTGSSPYPLPGGTQDPQVFHLVIEQRLELARRVLIEKGIEEIHRLVPQMQDRAKRGLSMLAFGGFSQEEVALNLGIKKSSVGCYATRVTSSYGKYLHQLNLSRVTEQAWSPG